MTPPVSERPLPRWTIGDFFIVMGAWLASGVVTSAIALTGLDRTTLTVMVALPIQSAGTAFGLWIVLRRRRARIEDLGFEVEPRDALFVGVGAFLATVLPLLLYPILTALGEEESGQALVGSVAEIRESTGLVILAGLSIVIIGPIMEELAFRGLLLRYLLQRNSPAVAILVSSLTWGAVHVVTMERGASLAQAGILVLGPFLLGLPLAWMAIRQGRLGWAIFTHAGYNLFVMVLLVLPPELLEQAANGA